MKINTRNMLVKELKKILEKVPNDIPVVIQVIDEDDINHIYVSMSENQKYSVNKILFGPSTYKEKEN